MEILHNFECRTLHKRPGRAPNTTIFFQHQLDFSTFNPIFDVTVFFCIFGPFLKVLALGTVTVGSALKNHAERSGREIQGSHGDPFRTIFCFQLRPPISGEPFFEPAPQFGSLPPLCPPNIQSNTKINLSMSTKNDQTAADIHRFFESMSTTTF